MMPCIWLNVLMYIVMMPCIWLNVLMYIVYSTVTFSLQAEELKSILGHAFRLAYAAHLQKSAGIHDLPTKLDPPSVAPTQRYSISNVISKSKNSSSNSINNISSHRLKSKSIDDSITNHDSSRHILVRPNSVHESTFNKNSFINHSSSINNNIPLLNRNDKFRIEVHDQNVKNSFQSETHTHLDNRPCDQSCQVS